MADPKRVASEFLKRAGNEYRLSVICANHKRDIKALIPLLAKKIQDFNGELMENSNAVGRPHGMVEALRRGDNMASVEALRDYLEVLTSAEKELLRAADLE